MKRLSLSRIWGFSGWVVLAWSLTNCSGPAREKFPGPPGRTTEVQQAQAQRAVLGGVDAQQAPVAQGAQGIPSHSAPEDGANPGTNPGAAAKPADPNASIKGVVQLEPGVKPKGTYLFIAVRPESGGPPLAVHRTQNPKFPYNFTISAADVMIPGTPFEGNVVVTARIKQDSDPLSHKPGDWAGNVMTKVGDHKLKIVLDQPVTE